MYVKFINHHTVEPFVPPVLVTEGRTYIHPTPEILAQHGYLPLVEDIAPAGGIKIYSTDGISVFSSTIPTEEEIL